ncbi:GTPase Era [Galdieria sulphuraria]|nr:GTPase Era [Galdieria sulphuraria]
MFLTNTVVSETCFYISQSCCILSKRRFRLVCRRNLSVSKFLACSFNQSLLLRKGLELDAFSLSPQSTDETKFGFIALLGRTNSGKSTLLNALVETKVAIVTPKVQTTRTKVVGIFTQGNSQLAFMDTPGMFTPKKRLERAMIEVARKAQYEADLIVLVVDVSKALRSGDDTLDETTLEIAKLCSHRKTSSELFLCLNKVDLVSVPQLKRVETVVVTSFNLSFREIFKVSALHGQGVREMRDALIPFLPQGPWLFDPDDMTSMSMRSYAAEITREKLILKLRQEIPYAIAVETVDWKDYSDGSIRILQHIFVERESQKVIIIGRRGQNLKQLGIETRQELAQIFGKPVHLFLQVKIRKDWSEDVEYYKNWGLKYRSCCVCPEKDWKESASQPTLHTPIMGDFLFQSIIVEMNNCQGKKCQKEQYDKQREQVAHYYGTVLSSNRDLKSSACCQAQEPSIHKAICSRLPDEILERFYGCGSPIPPALTNAIVLDLGCGTGRDVYVCSALVGVGGRVIGLDMLDSSLQVARKYQTTLSKQFFPDLESYSNVEFLCGYMEQLEEAGVERESCDLVISNCVINLVPNKEQVFRQVYYTLKVGGELYFSDIYTDRRMSEVAKTDPLLICECLGGALYLQDFKSIVESIGFLDPRMVTCKKVEHSLSNELESKIKNNTIGKIMEKKLFIWVQ